MVDLSFSKPRPGITFKNSKLYVFSACRVSVLKGWPDMAAWTRAKAQPQWRRFRPVLDIKANKVGNMRSLHRSRAAMPWPRRAEETLLHDPADIAPPVRADDALVERNPIEGWIMKVERRIEREGQLTLDFIAGIPQEVRSVVAQFPERHWHLLSMVARCGNSAMEVLRSNPALGFAIASCWVFSDVRSARAMGWIRRMTSRRRRDIAAALGFPHREASVQVLGKLQPDACSISNLLVLRRLIADPGAAKLLAHARVIDTALLALMTHTHLRASVGRRFLLQVAMGREFPVRRDLLPGIFYDYRRMSRLFQQKDERHRRFHSVEDLVAAHDALARRVVRQSQKTMADLVFPAPPLIGSDGIIPITSPDELRAEGRTQRNCVAMFACDVSAGQMFFYRMLEPERATIALRLNGAKWELNEVSAAMNRPVSEPCHHALGAWLGMDIPF